MIAFPECKLFSEFRLYCDSRGKNKKGKDVKCICNKQICGKVLKVMINT